MPLLIYHNPRCSKSRATLKLLNDNGYTPEVIEYLKTPPDAQTLTNLVAKLGVAPSDIMRTGEDAYRKDESSVAQMTMPEQISWLADHPQVLQRPIVVNGDRARIGRPPESVLEILS